MTNFNPIAVNVATGDLEYDDDATGGGGGSVTYGTTADTAAEGNDSRITGAAQKAANLSDLASAATALDNIGAAAASHTHAASDVASGTLATARLGSGTADSSSFLRGDQTWAAPAAGATIRDRRWTVPAGITSIDEFNDDSIAGAWTQINPTGAGSGHVTWAEGGDVLSVHHTASADSSGIHAIMQSVSSLSDGDGFETCFSIGSNTWAGYIGCGIMLADGATADAGLQVAGIAYANSTSALWETMCRTAANYADSAAGTVTNFATAGPVYLRMVRTAANTWRTDTSPDGVSWQLGATHSRTVTPTHAGLCLTNFGQARLMILSFEYFRRVSGIA